MGKARGILKFAMRMEKDVQQFYSYYEDKMKAPGLRELFGSSFDHTGQSVAVFCFFSSYCEYFCI